jgi:hypothetical protein
VGINLYRGSVLSDHPTLIISVMPYCKRQLLAGDEEPSCISHQTRDLYILQINYKDTTGVQLLLHLVKFGFLVIIVDLGERVWLTSVLGGYYHCSPTFSSTRFRPRPPRPVDCVKRAGSKGLRLRLVHAPSKTSSAIAFPQAGAHAMPLVQ